MLFLLLFLFVGASFVEEADIFGINGQIVHKLAFLKKYVPKETRLVLLGHSIGCYIILDMMKRNPELQVSGNIFKFISILSLSAEYQSAQSTSDG